MLRTDRSQQEYQLRALFHDVSILSPVQEEEESLDSPRRRPATRSTARSALLSPARPYSPLPPLVIEVEKRVNKHDHPEEFYVRLEKKMQKIYRRLFIEGRNVSSPMSTDDELEDSQDENRSEERSNDNIDIDEVTDNHGNTEPSDISDGSAVPADRSLKRRTTSDKDVSEPDEEEVPTKKSKSNNSSSADVLPRTSSEEEFDDETISSSIAEEHAKVGIDSFVAEQSIESVERDDTSSASGSRDHIQVTFQADVHRAYSDDDLPPPAHNGDDNDDEMDDGGDSANEGVEDPESADKEVEELLENNEVPGNNASSSPDEGDVVTPPRIQPDDVQEPDPVGEEIGELLERDEGPYTSLLAPAVDREVELMRTPLMRPSVSSLPERRESSSNDEQPLDIDFLNRTRQETDPHHQFLVSFYSGSLNRTRQETDDEEIEERDAATQTSFEDTGPEGWGNIFIGQPRVFTLCHCKHHVCE